MAFYWSPDNKCGKGVLRESLRIQLLTPGAGAASQAPVVPSLHPAGTQVLPLFSPLALTFPVLCVNPFYFPFTVDEESG